MAICVQPVSDSHSDRASRSRVVILNVRTSRATVPACMQRRQATTVVLWTSRPAQWGKRTSMPILLVRRRRGTSLKGTLETVLLGRVGPGTIRGARKFRIQLRKGLDRTKQHADLGASDARTSLSRGPPSFHPLGSAPPVTN